MRSALSTPFFQVLIESSSRCKLDTRFTTNGSGMPCLKTPHIMASILALVLNFVLMQWPWPFERLLDTVDAGHIIGLRRGMNSAMSSTDWRPARSQFPTLQTKSSLNGESTRQQIIGRQQHGHSVLQVIVRYSSKQASYSKEERHGIHYQPPTHEVVRPPRVGGMV